MLVELRWYDAKDGSRHRWYNTDLAKSIGWALNGRGLPSENVRPIPLPSSINELH